MSAHPEIVLSRPALPVLAQADVVIVGGSFAGVAAALTLAHAGRQVILVEARTYLGRELTATLRPWFDLPEGASAPDLIQRCIQAAGAPRHGDLIPLRPDSLKLCLEDQLLDAGVKLLYASAVVGIVERDGHSHSVIIGNKSGRQVLAAAWIIDATENALVARLAGGHFAPAPATITYRRSLEFDGVAALDAGLLAVPEDLGLVGNRIRVRPGYRGDDHRAVEYALAYPAHHGDPVARTRHETAARLAALGLVEHLMHAEPAFAKAYWAGASHELAGPAATRLTNPVAVEPSEAAVYAGPLHGLWLLNPSVGPADADPVDPIHSVQLGETLAAAMNHLPPPALPPEATVAPAADAPDALPLSVHEPDSPQRGRAYAWQVVAALRVPVAATTQVLVVGGGTSGATAAVTAARSGAKTLLVEMNAFLGGTGTYGGVHSYWFGRHAGFSAEVIDAVDAMHRRLRHRPPQGDVPKWNIEAKAGSLLSRAVDAGAQLLTNSTVIAVLRDGTRVAGVVVATREGPVALLADVVIDASGDGDVAAMAGAEFVYGAPRDHVTMWYSLAQFAQPGLTRGNFTSMVDVSNIEDYTRAILAGRRRTGRAATHDHGVYIAPRESRHILGDVVLTLTDQLLRRRWPDVINIAFSNSDMKGHATSDWFRIGLISPNLEIEIPYGALLPKGLAGILVVGKAISADHDALPAIRMQPDLENLGGVAGLAAAQAVREGCAPAAIGLPALQRRLIDHGLLPEDVLTRDLVPFALCEADLRGLLAQLDGVRPLYLYQDMEINEVFDARIPLVDLCCAGPQAIPLLEEAIATASGARRRLLAQALALLGAPSATPILVDALHELLAADRLPRRVASIRHVQDPPDQGAMPDAAYLLYSLSMVPDRSALPVWQRVADLLAHVEEDDLRDRNSGVFHYVDAVCAGAERLGDPATVPILEQMHAYAPLHRLVAPRGFQADYFPERSAYLEVVLGRTLARCGSPDGLVILIDYLEDSRGLLAEHAHSELVAITGVDLGKNPAAWGQWLEAEGDTLTPLPWQQVTDPVVYWQTQVLVTSADLAQARGAPVPAQ